MIGIAWLLADSLISEPNSDGKSTRFLPASTPKITCRTREYARKSHPISPAIYPLNVPFSPSAPHGIRGVMEQPL
jgi:hypothetical protein